MATEYQWQDGQFLRFDRESATTAAPAGTADSAGAAGSPGAVGEILVADSWRSEATRVAAFDYHVARFEDAVARVSQATFDWAAVWKGVATSIAIEGAASLFPRISLEVGAGSPEPCLILAIRPCPKARQYTSLTLFEGADPRHHPQIKGPDIARLAAAKDTAKTDDIILQKSIIVTGAASTTATDSGLGTETATVTATSTNTGILETSTGALIHWSNGGIVISNHFEQQLPSVTLRQVYDRARELDIPVTFREIRANELGQGPLWFVNAVHGVSPVLDIHTADGLIAVPEHPNEDEWRDWWWTTLQPIAETVARLNDQPRTHPSLHDRS